MKKLVMLLAVLIFSGAAIVAVSPLQLTTKIALEEKESCVPSSYEKEVMGTCTKQWVNNHCLNTSGPGTDCTEIQESKNYSCVTGTETVNTQKCTPTHEYELTIDTVKKKLDFSDFGPCKYEVVGQCVHVTCVAWNDGAHNGQFTDCAGGKSCQKFEVCENSIKSYVKNSREDFVESDPTFYMNKMQLVEVGK